MTSPFATVSKNKILAVNEAAAPANTKKETKLARRVYWSVENRTFLTEFATK